jgi:hypothetical protein
VGAEVRKLVPIVKRLNSELYEPLDFDCPSVVVNTDDGYQRTLEEVIARIDDLYSRPDIHDLGRASHSPEQHHGAARSGRANLREGGSPR